MFNKVPTIPVQNANSAGYDLGNGILCKVVLETVYKDNEQAVIQRTAYQVNPDGSFVMDANGHPIKTLPIDVTIHAANLQAEAHSINAAWIRDSSPQLTLDPLAPAGDKTAIPASWKRGSGSPNANSVPGNPGDQYFDDTNMIPYVYSPGLLEQSRQDGCTDLANLLGHAPSFSGL